MKIEASPDAESAARELAKVIAEEAGTAVVARGKFVMAASGGKTPWIMFRYLAREDLPWSAVRIVHVDERIAPSGDPDRNLTQLRENLLTDAPLRPAFFARAGLDLTAGTVMPRDCAISRAECSFVSGSLITSRQTGGKSWTAYRNNLRSSLRT